MDGRVESGYIRIRWIHTSTNTNTHAYLPFYHINTHIHTQPQKRRSIFNSIFGTEKEPKEKESFATKEGGGNPTNPSQNKPQKRPSAIRGAINYITGSGKAKEEYDDNSFSSPLAFQESGESVSTTSVVGELGLVNIMDTYSAGEFSALRVYKAYSAFTAFPLL